MISSMSKGNEVNREVSELKRACYSIRERERERERERDELKEKKKKEKRI